MPEHLLDWARSAERLGITERHLRLLWQRREIAAIKVGRAVRFDPIDLDAYIQAHRVEAVR